MTEFYKNIYCNKFDFSVKSKKHILCGKLKLKTQKYNRSKFSRKRKYFRIYVFKARNFHYLT